MIRKKLPVTRQSVTHRVVIARWKIYFTIGLYEDGTPGELFINDIESPEVGIGLTGFAEQWAIAVSMLLQAGMTVEELYRKYAGSRFAPEGFTDNKEIHSATSIVDYVVKFLKLKYGKE